MNRNPSTIHGGIRRLLFWYLFFTIVVEQAVFVMVAGFGLEFEFDPTLRFLLFVVVAPAMLVAWRLYCERRRFGEFTLHPWPVWALTGTFMFLFWSGSYFFIGIITDPQQATLLPPEWERFDSFVPFEPSFVFLYICVYTFYLLPYFHASRIGTIYRLALGTVVMLLISYVVFLSMPVTFPRPELPQGPELPVWVMRIVHGQDPPWNCLPSTHCAVAMLAALAVLETSRRMGLWAILTAVSIAVSTVFIKQHYIVDAVAGFALAGLTYWMLVWIWRNPDKVPEPARKIVKESG